MLAELMFTTYKPYFYKHYRRLIHENINNSSIENLSMAWPCIVMNFTTWFLQRIPFMCIPGQDSITRTSWPCFARALAWSANRAHVGHFTRMTCGDVEGVVCNRIKQCTSFLSQMDGSELMSNTLIFPSQFRIRCLPGCTGFSCIF